MDFDWTIQFSDVLKITGVAYALMYTINNIKNTTKELKNSIDHLTHAVEKIDSRTETNTKEIGNVRERIAVLESKLERNYS